MFKRIRIAVLLYVLLFVAAGQYLSARRSTDWDNTLSVDVYLLNGSTAAATQSFIDSLHPDAFAPVEQFLEQQARIYGVALERPFRIRLAGQIAEPLPPIPEDAGIVASVLWSLKMRWFVSKMEWWNGRWAPDITVFAVFHDAVAGVTLDRSMALRKGMIAVANLFASRGSHGSNGMIVAHELLHTLGASDKYDPATGLPSYPLGFADPDRKPRYPQTRAELMAGRIPTSADRAAVPNSLDQVMVGPITAAEIGWTAD